MIRLVLGGVGVALAAYGGLLLVGRGWADLVTTLVWLGGGVLLHDAVLAPATMVVVAVAATVVPAPWRAPVAVALVVVGAVTLVAVPVLGGFGARPDNPTLLDRPYWSGWAAFVTLAVGAALAAGAVRARRLSRHRGGPHVRRRR